MSAPTPPQDVLLVGFGAMGAIYSLILKRSGLARVTAVARSNYDVVNREGMHFRSGKYGVINGWRPDRLCKSIEDAADRQYSFVVVTTKAIPELNKIPSTLAPLLSAPYANNFSQPTYVLMQNGLKVELDLYTAIKRLGQGPPKIVSTAVWIGTNLLSPNVVEHNAFDRVAIGMYRYEDYTTVTNTPEELAILQDFGKILEAGGTTLSIVSEVQRMKFAKNFWNVAFSSFATLTRQPLPAIFRPPPDEETGPYEPFVCPRTAHLISSYTIPVIEGILTELLTVGRTLGFPDTEDGLPASTVGNVMDTIRRLHMVPNCTHVPSMLLDVQKGQPIEVEVIVGEVVRMARELNVQIPRIETLYGLLLIMQNQILREREFE